jgi:ubiquinone/menaquinone biosynthesis C-methylase UbiE
MNSKPSNQEIKDREHKTWSDVAEGWRKNDELLRRNAEPVTQRMLELAAISNGDWVLDIASGTGEPAIPAALHVGPSGKVIGTDLVEDMLNVARDKAKQQQIENIEFHCVDGETLPFDSDTFHAATIRWGLMFMPNPTSCLRLAHNVLKEDARLVVSCWAQPERNPFFTHIMSILGQYMELPQPPAGSPGVFAFADPDRLVNVIQESGFQNIEIEDLAIDMVVTDSGEEYWEIMEGLAGPIVQLMKQLDEDTRANFIQAVIDSANALKQDDKLRMTGTTWIAHASK